MLFSYFDLIQTLSINSKLKLSILFLQQLSHLKLILGNQVSRIRGQKIENLSNCSYFGYFYST